MQGSIMESSIDIASLYHADKMVLMDLDLAPFQDSGWCDPRAPVTLHAQMLESSGAPICSVKGLHLPSSWSSCCVTNTNASGALSQGH